MVPRRKTKGRAGEIVQLLCMQLTWVKFPASHMLPEVCSLSTEPGVVTQAMLAVTQKLKPKSKQMQKRCLGPEKVQEVEQMHAAVDTVLVATLVQIFSTIKVPSALPWSLLSTMSGIVLSTTSWSHPRAPSSHKTQSNKYCILPKLPANRGWQRALSAHLDKGKYPESLGRLWQLYIRGQQT